jgi:hypothetical protein
MCLYIYIYLYLSIYPRIYIYIYICKNTYKKRERERENKAVCKACRAKRKKESARRWWMCGGRAERRGGERGTCVTRANITRPLSGNAAAPGPLVLRAFFSSTPSLPPSLSPSCPTGLHQPSDPRASPDL